MMTGIDYKKRNLLLLGGTVVILLLCYLLAIDKTLSLYNENQALEKKVEQAGNAPYLLKQLEAEAGNLQKKMRFLSGNDDIREEILDLLDKKNTGDATLKSMKSPVTFRDREMLIETYEIILQGNFNSLTRSIYHIEQNMRLGRIAGVKYQLEKDRVNHKEILVARIYIQTSRKNESTEAI